MPRGPHRTIRADKLHVQLAMVAALALGVAARAQGAAATHDFLSLDDPGFRRHPALPFQGEARRLVFKGANARYRKYRTFITESVEDGANFAGDQALVVIGCGTGCATAFDVDLRAGRVAILPTGWFTNDLDLMYRPDSRYLKVLHRATRGGEERCLGQAYMWTGRRLAPVGPEVSWPVDGFVCNGFERPPR